eukprot:TRINITY_DN8841_c0_g1_i1.p1 TRINITY_DN8841_c0_g1~~TRINITY_DN8841_c0_g1_i1.p1  ORF type:complete len:246 (+),score=43.43 TRINITY_DN8841_c0_g1_i1:106-738(+)
MADSNFPVVRDSIAIAVLYKAADNLLNQAIIAHKSNDLEKAYVYYMKFSTFVLQHISMHGSYNNFNNMDDKAKYRAKCVSVIKEIENLQGQIRHKYGQTPKNNSNHSNLGHHNHHQNHSNQHHHNHHHNQHQSKPQSFNIQPSAPPSDFYVPQQQLPPYSPPYSRDVPIDNLQRQTPKILPPYQPPRSVNIEPHGKPQDPRNINNDWNLL